MFWSQSLLCNAQYIRSLEGGCDPGWLPPKCMRRLCPVGVAWNAGAPGSVQQDTGYAECSNAGYCDRRSGECRCFEGYTGAACSRNFCPRDCSGHGACVELDKVDFQNLDLHISNTHIIPATLYKYAKARACNCDPGWTGPSCTLRLCPRGDDPRTSNSEGSSPAMSTIHENDEVQALSLYGDGPVFGTFLLEFRSLQNHVYQTAPLFVPTTIFSDGLSFSGSIVTDPWRQLSVFDVGDHIAFANTVGNNDKKCLVTARTANTITCEDTTFTNESFVVSTTAVTRATFADLGTENFPAYTLTDANAGFGHFSTGDKVYISGSHRNDGYFNVVSATARTLVMAELFRSEEMFFNETDVSTAITFNHSDKSITDSATASLGAFQHVAPGDRLVVSGSGSNDGVFIVTFDPDAPTPNKIYVTTAPVDEVAPVGTVFHRELTVVKEKEIILERRLGVPVAHPGKMKWMLESLPEHILPNVTIATNLYSPTNLSYNITFVHSANTGDQHEFRCLPNGCDSSGCAPRHGGLFHLSTITNKIESPSLRTFTFEASSNTISLTGSATDNLVKKGFREGSVFQIAGTASNDGEATVKSFTTTTIHVCGGAAGSCSGGNNKTIVDESTVPVGAKLTLPKKTNACVVQQILRGTHESAICSGRGLCDTKHGNCECMHLFTGSDCSEYFDTSQ